MGLIANSQTFHPSASGVIVTATLGIFQRQMDSLLLGGWDFTIDLPAGRSPCPSIDCRFNSTYGKYQDANGGLCRDCRGEGFFLEPRYTIYKCNRRWTNEPLDQAENTGEKTIGGVIYGNFVRIKTVAASFTHIQQAIGASIDGVKVKLFKEPRLTGWGGTNLYVISWWERANKSNG